MNDDNKLFKRYIDDFQKGYRMQPTTDPIDTEKEAILDITNRIPKLIHYNILATSMDDNFTYMYPIDDNETPSIKDDSKDNLIMEYTMDVNLYNWLTYFCHTNKDNIDNLLTTSMNKTDLCQNLTISTLYKFAQTYNIMATILLLQTTEALRSFIYDSFIQ